MIRVLEAVNQLFLSNVVELSDRFKHEWRVGFDVGAIANKYHFVLRILNFSQVRRCLNLEVLEVRHTLLTELQLLRLEHGSNGVLLFRA